MMLAEQAPEHYEVPKPGLDGVSQRTLHRCKQWALEQLLKYPHQRTWGKPKEMEDPVFSAMIFNLYVGVPK